MVLIVGRGDDRFACAPAGQDDLTTVRIADIRHIGIRGHIADAGNQTVFRFGDKRQGQIGAGITRRGFSHCKPDALRRYLVRKRTEDRYAAAVSAVQQIDVQTIGDACREKILDEEIVILAVVVIIRKVILIAVQAGAGIQLRLRRKDVNTVAFGREEK